MVKLLCEKNFCESVWCKQILSGISASLKKKRISYVEIKESKNLNPEKDDSIFLIGSNDKWINDKVNKCNFAGIVPIVVCNQHGRTCTGEYHCVTVDIENAMGQLYSYMQSTGHTKAVFYGLNEASASDRGKAACFSDLFDEPIPVIQNNGSIAEAFEKLYADIDKFDTVICANDFVAVLLVKKLLETDREILKRLCIISCAKIMLSTVFEEYIVSQKTDFYKLGCTGGDLLDFLKDKNHISSVTLNIKCDGIGKTENSPNNSSPDFEIDDDAFYKDEAILTALKIDCLFSECKREDTEILKLICMGKTYTQIAEKCFMSESNVKYHVKKYIEFLGLKRREDLSKMLAGYLLG